MADLPAVQAWALRDARDCPDHLDAWLGHVAAQAALLASHGHLVAYPEDATR